MNIHEYQAKEILSEYGVKIAEGGLAYSVVEAVQRAREIEGGTGRVEFFELSTQNWDNNIDVKGYALKHGLTYPGAGQDGGAFAACAPYKNGTFGPFYGTPSFAVIDPTGEVNYGVRFTTSNQVEFDTAVARALRVTRNTGGGGGTGCAKVFSVNTITTKKPTQIIVQDITNSGPEYVLANGSYNCEFQLKIKLENKRETLIEVQEIWREK